MLEFYLAASIVTFAVFVVLAFAAAVTAWVSEGMGDFEELKEITYTLSLMALLAFVWLVMMAVLAYRLVLNALELAGVVSA